MNGRKKLELVGIQRQTPQRDQILEIIEAAQGPLSAREILQFARRKRPDLGLSTIYRTLDLLQKARQVRLVSLPDGRARYEKLGLGRHHFYCRICHKIFTLANQAIRFSGLKPEAGFLIEDYESTFYGSCPSCQSSHRKVNQPAEKRKL